MRDITGDMGYSAQPNSVPDDDSCQRHLSGSIGSYADRVSPDTFNPRFVGYLESIKETLQMGLGVRNSV